MLTEFKTDESWRELKGPDGKFYLGFDDFMVELKDRWNRGTSTLWAYQACAEKLLPLIPAEILDEIGITKAQELKRAAGMGAKLDDVIIEAARSKSVTLKELRGIIAQFLQLPDDRMSGLWFDFGGTYFTKEERLEFVECVELTQRLLNLKPEQKDVFKRHEIFMAWIREFVGTHYADVYGPQIEPPELPEAFDASVF